MLQNVEVSEADLVRACEMASLSKMSSLQASKLQAFFSKKPHIILGSASKSRRKLLDEAAREHQFEYEARAPDIDEKVLSRQGADPSSLVLTLGRYKAAKVFQDLAETQNLEDLQDTFLVTADQVVVFEGCIREKPEDEAQARRFIQSYSGSSARTIGSCVCTSIAGGHFNEGIDVAEVYFKTFPDDLADKLIEEGRVLQCAGGLMVEHPLVAPYVERVVGSMDSVMGLSKQMMLHLLVMAAEPRPPPPPEAGRR